MGNRVFLISFSTFLTLLLFPISSLISQPNIGGIINTYTAVTSITTCNPCTPTCNTITVSSVTGLGAPGGFNVGDRVMIFQMKGASIDMTNNAGFGTIASFGGAGYFEKLQIASIAGSDITFTTSLINTYDVAGVVQLVKYPTYANANVNTTLTALPWNGSVGGVLAFEVTGTLSLNANIDVSGLGFRGGISASNGFSYPCGLTDYFYSFTGDYGNGAGKGEGIAVSVTGYELGRGSWANGGGGGNSHNGGGGGGANGGAGGLGGREYIGCTGSSNMSGIGGKSLGGYTGIRAFLGGGGGAGHQNNNVGTIGANGGGIISITASQIIGNGFSILADGADALNTFSQGNDGAGGGGGGGTILLNITTFSGALTIQTKGGKGGDMIENVCHATGAGGGGGRLCFSLASLPGTVTTSVIGGAPGNTSSNCATSSGDPFYGATSGSAGMINTSCITSPPPGVRNIIANLGGDTKLCNPISATLNSRVTGPWYTYEWYKDDVLLPSETGQTLFVTSPGEYKVRVSSAGCNPGLDSVNITTDAAIPDDSIFCSPPAQSVQLKVIGSGKYKWWTLPVGGVSVGTGNSYTTGLISTDTTLYVEDTSTFSRKGFTPSTMLTGFNTRTGGSNTYMGFNAFTPFRIDSVTAFIRTYNTNTETMVVNLRKRGVATPLATTSLLVTGPCNCTVDRAVRFYLGFNVPIGNEYYLEYSSGAVNVHWDGSGASYPYSSPDVISIYGPVDGSGAPIGWAPASYGFFYNWVISAGTLCQRVPVRAIKNCALPVDLLKFQASRLADNIVLDWITSNEVNNSHFLIQRSTDGISFETIGVVAGNGTSQDVIHYNYLDYSPGNSTFYYRLIQTDLDGTTQVSHVVSVSFVSSQIHIYPNPFNNRFVIKADAKREYNFRMFNATGQLLFHSTFSNEFVFDENVPSGVYFIEISSDDRLTFKVLKFQSGE